MTKTEPFSIYRINEADLLVEASNGFWAYGASNGWTPDPHKVLGRPLWTFISGDATILLYRHLLRMVRESGAPLSFPLRCDSPSLRRDMNLTLTPSGQGGVGFIAEICREIPLHAAVAGSSRDNEQLICPVCHCMEYEDEWIPAADAVKDQLIEIGAGSLELHVCPDCPQVSRTDTTQASVLH